MTNLEVKIAKESTSQQILQSVSDMEVFIDGTTGTAVGSDGNKNEYNIDGGVLQFQKSSDNIVLVAFDKWLSVNGAHDLYDYILGFSLQTAGCLVSSDNSKMFFSTQCSNGADTKQIGVIIDIQTKSITTVSEMPTLTYNSAITSVTTYDDNFVYVFTYNNTNPCTEQRITAINKITGAVNTFISNKTLATTLTINPLENVVLVDNKYLIVAIDASSATGFNGFYVFEIEKTGVNPTALTYKKRIITTSGTTTTDDTYLNLNFTGFLDVFVVDNYMYIAVRNTTTTSGVRLYRSAKKNIFDVVGSDFTTFIALGSSTFSNTAILSNINNGGIVSEIIVSGGKTFVLLTVSHVGGPLLITVVNLTDFVVVSHIGAAGLINSFMFKSMPGSVEVPFVSTAASSVTNSLINNKKTFACEVKRVTHYGTNFTTKMLEFPLEIYNLASSTAFNGPPNIFLENSYHKFSRMFYCGGKLYGVNYTFSGAKTLTEYSFSKGFTNGFSGVD